MREAKDVEAGKGVGCRKNKKTRTEGEERFILHKHVR